MVLKRLFVLFTIVFAALFGMANKNQEVANNQHLEVSMRMIGHQVLLSLGDSTSRVLPIERDGNVFKIPFESEFRFSGDSLGIVIDSVIAVTGIAEEYIVQFITCNSNQVAHSYEVGVVSDVMACQGRSQPRGCYYLQITIVSPALDQPEPSEAIEAGDGLLVTYSEPLKLIGFLVLVVVILVLLIVILKNRNRNSESDSDIVQLGEYVFNRRTMELILGNERIELTSKECDLLQLLYESVNDTVERDTILRMVWNDEGDYVGRTLDVFISKLRKKLEADSRIKIANIRGVGYKLIVDA